MNRLLVLVCITLTLAGCALQPGQSALPTVAPTGPPTMRPATVTPLPSATPVAAPSQQELAARVDAAEQRWQQSQIASYRISVTEVHSIWSAQTNTVTVTNGIVTDLANSCIPAPAENGRCTPKAFEPTAFLVPALFARARTMLADHEAEYLVLQFDQQLGYPTQLSYDNPKIADEEYTFRVVAFETLAGLPAEQLGETLMLRPGQSAQAKGLTVEFVRVKEDSRCPQSVACVWAGQVVVELKVSGPDAPPATLELKLMGTGVPPGEVVPFGQNWTLQLTAVTPYPATPDTILTTAYVAAILVSEK